MIGEVIAGRYRITARIGSGGTGEVYEAQDLELPRKAAIKLMSLGWGDDDRLRQRFLREAHALSLVDHPHVCTIYKAGETETGKLYIAMAYYEGEHLRARLAHGPLPIVKSVATALAIAEGMDKAHRKGVLHRDLKPENIIFTEDGVVKILDFGLAKLSSRTQMTETGVTMGTLAYASPEQIRGESLDERSDVYSLGILLYQMVTGIAPFVGNNAAQTIQLVLNSTPERPTRVREETPVRLEALIAACMSREAAQRPPDMTAVQDELIEILTEISPSAAARHRAGRIADTLVDPIRPRSRNFQIPLLVVLALVLLATQYPRIRSLLTPAPPPATPGIAILPIEPEGTDADLALLAAGISRELQDQTVRISAYREGWWVLPEFSTRHVTPANARKRSGVSATLGGTLRRDGDQFLLNLELNSTENQLTLASGTWRVPEEQIEIRDWLARGVQLELESHDRAELESRFPESAEARLLFLRGRGLRSRGEESAPVFASALALEPESADVLLQYAAALADAADSLSLARSESLLTRSWFPTTLQAERHETLSRVHSARGDSEGAARELNESIRANPANPEWYRKLVTAWLRLQMPGAAERACHAAIRENPGYTGAHELLGYFYFTRNRFPEAIEVYRQVVALAPEYPNGWNTLGACYYALERWDEATHAFETSFRIEQNFAACSNLGTLYYMQGEFEKADSMYEWAWKQDPSDYRLLGNRASALRWVPGREDEARELNARAAELARIRLEEFPDEDPGVTLAFRAGYLVQSDPEHAIELIAQALRIGPDDAEVHYRAAVIHEEMGERASALTELGIAIDLGHPLLEINNERLLDDLRQDSRYRLLLP